MERLTELADEFLADLETAMLDNLPKLPMVRLSRIPARKRREMAVRLADLFREASIIAQTEQRGAA